MPANKDKTYIYVSKDSRKRINDHAHFGMTYEDVVKEMLDLYYPEDPDIKKVIMLITKIKDDKNLFKKAKKIIKENFDKGKEAIMKDFNKEFPDLLEMKISE